MHFRHVIKHVKPELVCISIELQNAGIRSKTIRLGSLLHLDRSKQVEAILNIARHNINVVHEHVKYCSRMGWNYRIPSGIIPLCSHEDYWNECLWEKLDWPDLSVYGVRLSIHPDQFTVLGSEKREVQLFSMRELIYHSILMDKFKLPRSYFSPINIHLSCGKYPMKDLFKRFSDNYKELPLSVTSRLTLENEHAGWSVFDLKPFFEQLGIPICYDSHHFRCNPKGAAPAAAWSFCLDTWRNIKPLFHFSNGKTSPSDKSHSDYVYDIHEELFRRDVNGDIYNDVAFEFKAKDLAIKEWENKYKLL